MPVMTPEQAKALREPFRPEQVGKLPKPTKRDNPKGRCAACGGWHGLPAVHLDYVGHAAITDRLLQVDPVWTWEPMAVNEHGFPLLDSKGGLWIRLTVCGVTRPGYGDETAGRGMKEIIGDALRNAAMRFGVGLDLWSKEDLQSNGDVEETGPGEGGSPLVHSATARRGADPTGEGTLTESGAVAGASTPCPSCGHPLKRKREGKYFCAAREGGCGKEFESDKLEPEVDARGGSPAPATAATPNGGEGTSGSGTTDGDALTAEQRTQLNELAKQCDFTAEQATLFARTVLGRDELGPLTVGDAKQVIQGMLDHAAEKAA